MPVRGAVGVWLGLLAPVVNAATLHVHPTAGNDAWTGLCATSDGGTCGPKATVQAAIDAAAAGDEVVLAAGTYTGAGNRDMDYAGKAITVRSTDPEDPVVVAATVLDLQGTPADPHRAF